MTTDTISIARTYFDSWLKRDFETFRGILAYDVTFVGPLGKADNAEECVEGMKGLSMITTEINIQHMWADGPEVITWFELHTTITSQAISVVNWSHIEKGLIKQIRVTFDPRPLMT